MKKLSDYSINAWLSGLSANVKKAADIDLSEYLKSEGHDETSHRCFVLIKALLELKEWRESGKKERRENDKNNKWKHACMSACAKIKRLQKIMDLYDFIIESDKKEQDELVAEINDWQALYARLGGDDYFNKEQTPDDLFDMVCCLEKRERACAAYSIAEELGTATVELTFEQDCKKVEEQVRSDAGKLKARLETLTEAYDLEQKRAEKAEEKLAKEASLRYNDHLDNITLTDRINVLEAQLAEYVEIVKNLAKQSFENEPPAFIPIKFTYSAPCRWCGKDPGDYAGLCYDCSSSFDV